MELLKRRRLIRVVTAALMLTMTSWLLPADMAEVNAETATQLQNPRIVADTSMKSGQVVTWDCIWLGSYPQREVILEESSYNAVNNAYYYKESAVIEDAALFRKLVLATDWDSNGEITIDGSKYRRVEKSDAEYTPDNSANHYKWDRLYTYHYFKYEPIKWRVLKVNGTDVVLLADKALYAQRYESWPTAGSLNVTTWEKSSLRSWLNGYDGSKNQCGIDYTSNNFINTAFTANNTRYYDERCSIRSINVVNSDNLVYDTEGGNDTNDKIFLLSESEVYNTENAKAYGFVKEAGTYDEGRICKSSTYAKAMGVYSSDADDCKGNCVWWLRSPGCNTMYAACVGEDGKVKSDGKRAEYDSYNGAYLAVRPALELDTNYYTWSYAGTVSSRGTAVEDINNSTITLQTTSYVFDGKQKTPAVTVKYRGNTLVDGTDYTVEYGTNTAVGKGQVTINGKGDFGGSAALEFDITPADLASCNVTLQTTSYTYDGKQKTPAVTVAYNGYTFTEGTDYTVAYSANTAAGKGQVTVTAKGDKCTGEKTLQFNITSENISKCDMALSQTSYKYDEQQKKPDVTVKYSGDTLTNGTDYTVEYGTNIAAGKGQVTVAGKGNFTGRKTLEFDIMPADFGRCGVTLSALSYTYNGKQKKPAVTVMYNGKKLNEGKHYSIEYDTNIAAGKGRVTVTGKGNFTGQIVKEFNITPADFSKCSTVIAASSYTYSGKTYKPAVTVIDGSKELSADDYTVTYSGGCKDVGKYKVIVTAKGNYTGTKTFYFTINPKATSVSKLTKGSKSFKAYWSKVSSQATGYQLQYALNSKFTKSKKTVTVKSYKTTSKTISKLKAKKKYYVKVRTYKKVGSTTYYSSWSKTKTVTTK